MHALAHELLGAVAARRRSRRIRARRPRGRAARRGSARAAPPAPARAAGPPAAARSSTRSRSSVLEAERRGPGRAPGLVLHPPAAQRLAQLVARDPVQPGHRLAAAVVGVRTRGDHRERLRRQVERQLGVRHAPAEERDDRVQVRPIERRERGVVAAGDPLEQLAVIAPHTPIVARTRRAVTVRPGRGRPPASAIGGRSRSRRARSRRRFMHILRSGSPPGPRAAPSSPNAGSDAAEDPQRWTRAYVAALARAWSQGATARPLRRRGRAPRLRRGRKGSWRASRPVRAPVSRFVYRLPRSKPRRGDLHSTALTLDTQSRADMQWSMSSSWCSSGSSVGLRCLRAR